MWFIGVDVDQETSAPPPKKNPGSRPCMYVLKRFLVVCCNAGWQGWKWMKLEKVGLTQF